MIPTNPDPDRLDRTSCRESAVIRLGPSHRRALHRRQGADRPCCGPGSPMDGAFLQETHQQVRHVLEPLLQLEKTLRKITEASQSTSFDWHGDLWKDEELNGVLHDMPGPVGQADSPTSHKSSKGFLEENAVQAGEGTGTPLHELMRMSEASSLSHASLSSANGTSTRARVRISDSDGHRWTFDHKSQLAYHGHHAYTTHLEHPHRWWCVGCSVACAILRHPSLAPVPQAP
ncbi:unnamed protein product, partial [Durusdinium trenchii]